MTRAMLTYRVQHNKANIDNKGVEKDTKYLQHMGSILALRVAQLWSDNPQPT